MDWHKELTTLGLEASPERIVTSASLTAHYMQKRHPSVTKALCFGSDILKEELTRVGVTCQSEHADTEGYDAMIYKL